MEVPVGLPEFELVGVGLMRTWYYISPHFIEAIDDRLLSAFSRRKFFDSVSLGYPSEAAFLF
jgi:hypothetical protein